MKIRNLFRKKKEVPLLSSKQITASKESHGQRHGVMPAVHSEDHIFRFCLEHECFKDQVDNAVGYYFDTSAESATKLIQLIADNAPAMEPDFKLLEFASGYGAVTRHLKNLLPKAAVTACDIHPQAIQFIREDLGCDAAQSRSNPSDFQLPQSYDVVFALSFFSHMPDATWAPWLQALSNHVKPGGLLIFTTHGKESLKHFGHPECDSRGFWFKPDSEQLDLDAAEYGLTVTFPDYVNKAVGSIPELKLLEMREAFWWEHQDVYVTRKI